MPAVWHPLRGVREFFWNSKACRWTLHMSPQPCKSSSLHMGCSARAAPNCFKSTPWGLWIRTIALESIHVLLSSECGTRIAGLAVQQKWYASWSFVCCFNLQMFLSVSPHLYPRGSQTLSLLQAWLSIYILAGLENCFPFQISSFRSQSSLREPYTAVSYLGNQNYEGASQQSTMCGVLVRMIQLRKTHTLHVWSGLQKMKRLWSWRSSTQRNEETLQHKPHVEWVVQQTHQLRWPACTLAISCFVADIHTSPRSRTHVHVTSGVGVQNI